MRSILKKSMAYLLTLTLLISLVPFSAMQVSAAESEQPAVLSGSGTETDPFLIGTHEELKLFRDSVNAGNDYKGKYVKVVADGVGVYELDADRECIGWKPIGSFTYAADGIGIENEKPFNGTFDGGGHTISAHDSAYKDSGSPDYRGLFGCIGESGTVKNLTVTAIEFEAAKYVGLVAVLNKGTVENITASSSWGISAKGNAGGIVGENRGTIRDCTAETKISADYKTDTYGGIAGKNFGGQIIRCKNTSNVNYNENSSSNVGGICGLSENDGDKKAVIQECYNSSKVYGESNVGGICGKASGTEISDCYNIGIVTANTANAGGICGEMAGNISVSSVYNCGNVSAAADFGAIYGKKAADTVTDAYYLDGSATGGASQEGALSLSKNEFSSKDNFGGFDFNTIWVMNIYLGRPILRSVPELNSGTEEGTEDNPYRISNVDDLRSFRDAVNGGNSFEGKFVRLTDDVVADNLVTPIGNDSSQFKGTFDGGDHSIFNLRFAGKSDSDYLGLFGYIGEGGTVKNLAVWSYNEHEGKNYIGIVAGYSSGTIENVTARGMVTGEDYVGGIVGNSVYGTIKNCKSLATVKGNSNVGGIAGCIIGKADKKGKIIGCYNMGNIIGKSITVSEPDSPEADSDGNVTKKSFSVGGIVGNCGSNTNVAWSYNAESVSGADSVGGIAGYSLGSVSDCYNIGSITGTERDVGGICGRQVNDNSGIKNVYNYGTVNADGASNFGAICGFLSSSKVENAYYLEGTAPSGADSIHGASLSKENFSDSGKFVGFDFRSTWEMNTDFERPVLTANKENRGTKDNPILISSLDDLKAFRDSVNGGNNYENMVVELMTDIDLRGESWEPIGHLIDDHRQDTKFGGTFDGNGHKITGLYINNNKEYQGLFGLTTCRAVIRNLSVSGDVTGEDYVGIVVGMNNGTVKNVAAYGKVNGYRQVGGIAGYNNLTTYANEIIPGVISKCANFAAVTGEMFVGGICGQNTSFAEIRDCYNTAAVTAEKYNAGGICGCNNSSSKIQNCYNTAAVTAEKYNAGGICGCNNSSSKIQNCYNTAAVTANKDVGGICGENSGSGSVENCYYLDDGGLSDASATGLSAAQFVDSETFIDWDFLNTWEINPLLGRPVLRSNIEGESGTESDPYVIDSLETFEKFRDNVNNGASCDGKFVKLTSDIDLSAKYNSNNQWTPIGTREKPFSGTFDGNGHKVSGLYINDLSASYQGLFGSVSGGTIKKLAVTDAQVAANKYFAGIAAEVVNGRIENCYYIGTLSHNDVIGGYYGAIAGDIKSSTVTNCYANAIIPTYSTIYSYSGVVVGCVSDNSLVSSCYFLDYEDGRRGAVGGYYSSSEVVSTSGKTSAELADKTTYVNWDFEKVWTIHPILKLPTFAGGGFSGTGTENDPYIISTVDDLEILATAVNSGNNFEKTYFALNSDIDMGKKYNDKTEKSWNPIGNSVYNAFSGVFDGKNHKITGLYINGRTDYYTGLFGYVSYGNWYEEGETYRAAIKNLTVSGSITAGGNYIGGLVGCVDSGAVLENCGAYVDITSDSYYVGGLVGVSYGTIKNSFASGNISANGTVGGLVGESSSELIQNCYSLGSVTGKSAVGGLIGNTASTVVNCYSLAKVTGGKPLFGDGWGTVKNCYYTGNISDKFSESVRKTRAQFESGSVAYLLSKGCTVFDDYSGDTIIYDGSIWKQTIGDDKNKFPNFTGLAIYATSNCITYNNSGDVSEKQHSYGDDGVCGNCGNYLGAKLVDGVYQIENKNDLIWFAELVNGGAVSANAIVKNDISFNANSLNADGSLDVSDNDALESFTPMGNADKPYSGTFDGNGHTISGIYIDNSELSYAGLFGVTGENALIKNLTVRSTYVEANKYVGIIAGQNNGEIKFCKVYGDVTGVYSNYNGGIIGGIAGENNGIIEGDKYNPTEFSGNVTMRYKGEDSGGGYLGGIAGSNMGTIRYALNSGKIGAGTNCQYVGGICGVNGSFGGGKAATVENCTNIGSVSGQMFVGGICGTNYKDAKVKGCANASENEKSEIEAESCAGGIVGENYGNVSQCVNNKDAEIKADLSQNESLAGGIAGSNYGSISDCINHSASINGSNVGGIGGKNDIYDTYKGTMQYCLNMVSTPVLGTCTEGADAPVNCYYYFYEGSEKYDYGEAVTDDDIGNGYVTYHLQNGRNEQIWGQEIGRDSMPILTSNNTKRVFKVVFTMANGNVEERYHTYYTTIYPPTSQGWWTENGKLIGSNISVMSDIDLEETLYFVTASGCNITVCAQKGTYALITASYDENGNLVRTETTELTFDESGEKYLAVMPYGATAKVFLWDSFISMKPLCKAAQITD